MATDSVEAAEEVTNEAVSAPEPAAPHEITQEEPELAPITLGKIAEALLSNPAVNEAFRVQIHGIVDAWENTEPTDTAAREALYHQFRAVRSLKTELNRLARVGGSALRKQERGLRVA